MTGAVTGGCQCGRVRYRIEPEDAVAYLCHCRMCQKATGGFAAALVQVPDGALIWASEPEWYVSSPIARRPFCSKCGSPLGFCYNDGTGQDVTLGSLDDPSPFRPEGHFGAESLHAAWIDLADLPQLRSDESASVAARWQAAGLEVPE
jgi:hypothetical protein